MSVYTAEEGGRREDARASACGHSGGVPTLHLSALENGEEGEQVMWNQICADGSALLQKKEKKKKERNVLD
jgi:hypothetical protein